ncbi:hypothetical protein [Nonomuraea dietziae]|uniref:hypothetical protein n=1 Tax=Nonomuraea dietziae TaxID=65515 RepID=UPI0031DEBF1F
MKLGPMDAGQYRTLPRSTLDLSVWFVETGDLVAPGSALTQETGSERIAEGVRRSRRATGRPGQARGDGRVHGTSRRQLRAARYRVFISILALGLGGAEGKIMNAGGTRLPST